MTRFALQTHRLKMTLSHAFTIARGTKTDVENVIVHLQAEGVTGWGEAAPNLRYDEDAPKVENFLRQLAPEESFSCKSYEDLEHLIYSTTGYVAAGAVALEMAWWDWVGKANNKPLWQMWDLPNRSGPVSSFTIGLDDPDLIREKVREADKYPILKVKLGGSRDREIIRAIRSVTDKPVRVDANEGWRSLDEAVKMVTWLADRNIELVEQPMPSSMHSDMIDLKKSSPIPLIADESFLSDESLPELKQGFHGINIKLMKMGGLRNARKKLNEAKSLGLQTMIGCMIESSLANTAGAIAGLEADYADLDGHLLIDDDPYEGLMMDEDHRILLPDRPGLGVVSRI